jgi:enoyl-CoA hydratase/carnithine racemase
MAGEYETLIYDRDGARGCITLNRPELLNAVAMTGVRELDALARDIERDPALRLVTITGSGRAFSTGIDLKDLSAGTIDDSYFDLWDRALRRFETMDKLVLCLIHGYALGGGLQLALAADIRVCTPSAKLGVPAIKEGLIPGLGTFRLARYVGLGRAKRLIISGATIEGREAERIGLVDHLVDETDALAEFERIADGYAAVNSEGCRHAKALLADCFDRDFESFFALYKERQERATASADFHEAMAAYRDKRWPVWS